MELWKPSTAKESQGCNSFSPRQGSNRVSLPSGSVGSQSPSPVELGLLLLSLASIKSTGMS